MHMTDVAERRLEMAPLRRSEWLATRKVVAEADDHTREKVLSAWASRIRRSVVSMIDSAQLGHIGGDLSVADILTVAYLVVLRVDPADPLAADRDRFILSKGHCAASLYSALAYAGYFDPRELATFAKPLSPLGGHPNRNLVPGVEASTGPLGHGLPVGVGAALGARLRGDSSRVIVITGDGELQEGSNWEALLAAAHHRLGNLTMVVDRNGLQQGACTEATNRLEPLADKLAAFGWEVTEIDGHDYRQLIAALSASAGVGRPRAVIANTVKGKGVSFIEDRVEWHHKVPTPEQVRLALEELA
ncbi:MAG: transketolase [Trebonia sp.]